MRYAEEKRRRCQWCAAGWPELSLGHVRLGFPHEMPKPCTAPTAEEYCAELERKLKELGEQLEYDRTAVADAITAAKKAIDSRDWLGGEGRGSYEWNDDRYRAEFGAAVKEIRKALEPLAKIAADWNGCPRS